MNYLKNLGVNFLVVCFADHVIPGVEVADHTKIPHIGGDFIFAFILGFLNLLIFPALKVVNRHMSAMKIALVALILNFLAYGVVKLFPLGISVTSVEGYIFVSGCVAIGSFLTNYFEMKHHSHKTDLPL